MTAVQEPRPGWYPDPSGAGGQRYFDGTDWADATDVAPGPAPVLIAPAPVVPNDEPLCEHCGRGLATCVHSPCGHYTGARQAVQRMSREDRADLLSMELARQVGAGARMESRSDHQAVLVYGNAPNHVVHALLTLVTCGAWLIVWLPVAALQREHRVVLQVDQYGMVTRC